MFESDAVMILALVLGKRSSLIAAEQMSETVWGEGKMERMGAWLGRDELI